jgi:chromosome segregation ATPase
MELSPGWVSAGCAVVGLVGGGFAKWILSSLKEQKEDTAREIVAVKVTQKGLFEKYDNLCDDLQDNKLHNAETYVNRDALKEQLAPINKALEKIDSDLRDMRNAP